MNNYICIRRKEKTDLFIGDMRKRRCHHQELLQNVPQSEEPCKTPDEKMKVVMGNCRLHFTSKKLSATTRWCKAQKIGQQAIIIYI